MELSGGNKRAKLIRSLSRKKSRTETGLFLVEGYRFVREIPQEAGVELYAMTADFLERHPDFPFRAGSERLLFSKEVFAGFADTQNAQGVLALCRQNLTPLSEVINGVDSGENALIFVLDGIKDPGNLGTIIRTADAAGVDGVILANHTVDLYNPKVLRATMGSIFRLPITAVEQLEMALGALKKEGFEVLATSIQAKDSCYDIDYAGKKAVVIGSEAEGISEAAIAMSDSLLKIPILGGAESLNAAVAASVVMYEALRQKGDY